MRYIFVLFLAAFLFVPVLSFAAGAHDGLNCTGCHGIHTAKGDVIFAVEPNKKSINPKTKQPSSGTTALCLGCHETMDKGGIGIMPVSPAMSHPFGIAPNPKIATVPSILLRDGKLECVGCHDPHPSNPNYKYLRTKTDKGATMQVFCAMCHGSKSGTAETLNIFDSMDERKAATAAPKAAPAPAPKK
ncbi:MAG: cytochrome c3 family protein [Thermodesulfovibrionales bacterium]|nr:cytochrome c3 family protein [Thermodesulfovibrionales bacterium]